MTDKAAEAARRIVEWQENRSHGPVLDFDKDACTVARAYLAALPAAPTQGEGSIYGYCPVCGAMGVNRERRPNGNDQCANGHTYPSAQAHAGGGETGAQ